MKKKRKNKNHVFDVELLNKRLSELNAQEQFDKLNNIKTKNIILLKVK
jgi:hypothetical protein